MFDRTAKLLIDLASDWNEVTIADMTICKSKDGAFVIKGKNWSHHASSEADAILSLQTFLMRFAHGKYMESLEGIDD